MLTKPRSKYWSGTIAGFLLLVAVSCVHGADPWAEAMRDFSEQDQSAPFPRGQTVFVGSSSIRLWDLPQWFPERHTHLLNRGFGGSQLPDCLRHWELLVLRHRPARVVVYCGDNDIAAARSPKQVCQDYQTFCSQIHEELPDARLAYISIKPSLARWNLAEKIKQANHLIQQHCQADKRLSFIDVWAPMIGENCQPREELFVQDGLHLSEKGYQLWSVQVERWLSQNPKQAEAIRR